MDVRAEIYPLPEWQKIEEKLAQIPSLNPAKKKFLDRVNYYGQMAEMDAQGRVLLPQILRETAKLGGDVVVFGAQTYLEVANHDEFKQSHGHRSFDRGRSADIGELWALR